MGPGVADGGGTNLRARRTRRAIWEAFVDLLKTRPADRIQVTEICRRALVHRVTFYKHFESKQDLLERGGYEALAELATYLEPPEATLAQMQSGSPPTNFTALFHYAAAHRPTLAALLGESGAGFRSALAGLLGDLAVRRLGLLEDTGGATDAIPAGVAGAFSAGALVSVLEWWLNEEHPPEVPEMARILGRLFTRGFAPRLPGS